MAIVEHDGVRVSVRRRTIKDRITMIALNERFAPEPNSDASKADIEIQSHQAHFCDLMACTSEWSIDGESIPLLTKDASQAEFDVAFERYCELPELFFLEWLDAAIKVQQPYTPPEQSPESSLSEAQKNDPNSDAPAS